MKTNELFESKWLRAADLPKPVIVKIRGVELETFIDGSEKAVVFFEDLDKGLILNQTNCRVIEAVAKSGETDEWVGVSIRLFATEVDFKGRRVPAIRVSAPPAKPGPSKSQTAKQPVVQDDDDDIAY